jgi:hypothetical protein
VPTAVAAWSAGKPAGMVAKKHVKSIAFRMGPPLVVAFRNPFFVAEFDWVYGRYHFL